jgi:hypothetical protein
MNALRTFQNSSTRSYASAKKKITANFKYSLPAQALQHLLMLLDHVWDPSYCTFEAVRHDISCDMDKQ